jgi:hypothetical protein
MLSISSCIYWPFVLFSLILTIDAEKAFDQIQHLFMIKTLKKLGIEGMHFSITMVMCNKPITNIMLNGRN